MSRVKNFVLVLLAGAACFAWWKYLDIRIRAALAEEQTQFFDEMLQLAAKRKSVDEIAADKEAIRIYYPSGSKQRRGSHLDRMVERARASTINRLDEQASKLRKAEKSE